MADNKIFRTSEIPTEFQGRVVRTTFFIQEVPSSTTESSTLF